VLIHDAARPLVSHALISRVLEGLQKHAAVYPALPVADTLRQGSKLLDRTGLLAAQTPQGFRFEEILEAHRKQRKAAATDDIALAEAAGLAIGVVEGERCNFKLTAPGDLELMQQLTQAPFETRVGMGVDVHPFVAHDGPHRSITLCGVKIPCDQRLHGHSDADAALHALVDAILGAIGEGDIGQHFSSDDPQWAGADSSRFLIHAYQLLKAKGGEIVNIDITVIGEKPRIAPFRAQMAAQVAGVLKIATSRVNIKATTTEKLGFLGRGEGLAAQAIVSVKLPA
jgi:2-C-methyl-D-erythritol 4-phosphate cytidylyltransferase/2-C-methyl-D-erythritol 2,4-cyclodiphosphate synthase